jgi:hypothetical protein
MDEFDVFRKFPHLTVPLLARIDSIAPQQSIV